MSQTFLSPDRLYDRHWRPGHPFRRNPSAKRRWTMLLLFAFLCGLIGGYLYITDPKRVKELAESELTRLIGGHVTVGKAKLSLFEGLRLEYVNVYVDRSGADDALLFSANQFFVDYDPRALLTGDLKLTRIAAIDPTVQLIENLDTGRWNYQRMRRGGGAGGPTSKPGQAMPALPQVILRNAQIEYAETIGGQPVSAGRMAIEGQLAPSSDGQRYTFELQSRGGSAVSSTGSIGPTVQGTLRRDTGEVTASLRDFRFGQDVRSMLPAQVRVWWDLHNLAGEVDVPMLAYTPQDGEAKFRVETVFRKVNLTVRPEEWMSRDEIIVQEWAADAFDAMRDAGLNTNGVVDRVADLAKPSPIRLDQVRGNFVFTEAGIQFKEVEGQLEENLFTIDGKIDGYSPLSQAKIHIASTQTKIPAQPQYITSMPPPVRELYGHLRPQGICTLQVTLERPTFGSRLEFAGAVDIIDGNFIFDKFPYPVRAATGKVVFGYDERTGYETVRIVGLHGKGVKGGPNEEAIIHLSGLIGPLTSDVGVFVKVSSENVRDDPVLRAAFPPEVKKALQNLDADGKGEFPTFFGGFECRVNRPRGPRSPWIIETDVELKEASGKFAAFPYLMKNVTGKLAIRDGYVQIINATMRKNDSSLTMDGVVTWRAGAGGRPLEPGEIAGKITPARPDLKITARNVPLDKELLAALPDDRRAWLTKVGLTGAIDIDGRVWWPSSGERDAVAKTSAQSDLTHAFDLTLHNGTIWPLEGTFAISNLNGNLRLLPDRVIISQMSAKRGNAELTGRGELSWPQNNPSLFVSGTASRLELDRDLYRVLPPAAQAAWDAVQPQGSVDVDLTYSGAVGGISAKRTATTKPNVAVAGAPAAIALAAPATQSSQPLSLAASRPASPMQNLELIISPVKLAATLRTLPYRLTDITGTVRLNGGKVTLTDVTGKHGGGTIRVSGSGVADKTDWDLRLSAENVTVDEEFIRALPSGLQTVIDGIKMAGVVSFDFPKLKIRQTPLNERLAAVARPAAARSPAAAARAAAAHANGTPTPSAAESVPLDVDFAVRLSLNDAALDVGVAMTHVGGRMGFEGSVRSSRLADLTGSVNLPSLTMADRSAQDVHAEFFKPANRDGLHIGNITGRLAGGKIDGHVNLTFPDEGASRYVMELILRDADIRELSGEMNKDLSGRLSASLDLQGDWSDTRTRRGRGDVSVSGKEMYKIPLILGLLQITNLSLPITAPFNQGHARYMVDGQMLTIESLELRSRDMVMSGSGQLDFAKKKVAMSFTTDNPNWPKFPIVGDIIHTAKNELLQIHIKGTLQDPKVSASNTVTTTVDEVLRGDGK
jgi:hypothetical protein